jgi:hypothetical protein
MYGIDWHAVVGVISGLIFVGSVIPYILSMIHGTTRPNLITWILWTLIEAIVVGAQFYAGASWSIMLPIAGLATSGDVVFIGLQGYHYHQRTMFDVICLCLGLVAIVTWLLTNNPLTAIIFSIMADFIAAVPTILKSYQDPHSESMEAFLLVFMAAILSLISTSRFDLANTLWPLYFIGQSGLIVALIFLGKKDKKRMV